MCVVRGRGNAPQVCVMLSDVSPSPPTGPMRARSPSCASPAASPSPSAPTCAPMSGATGRARSTLANSAAPPSRQNPSVYLCVCVCVCPRTWCADFVRDALHLFVPVCAPVVVISPSAHWCSCVCCAPRCLPAASPATSACIPVIAPTRAPPVTPPSLTRPPFVSTHAGVGMPRLRQLMRPAGPRRRERRVRRARWTCLWRLRQQRLLWWLWRRLRL